MKILLILIFCPIICFSQKQNNAAPDVYDYKSFIKSQDSVLHLIFPFTDSKVHYELTIQVDSTPQSKLFERAKIWQVKMFNSPKDAQQSQDKDLGFIAFKTVFTEPYNQPLGNPLNLSFWFTIKIYVKNNRGKIVIDDIKMLGPNDDQLPIESYFVNQTENEIWMLKQLPKRTRKRFIEPEEKRKEILALDTMYRLADQEFKGQMENFKNAISKKSESDF